jgi:hypothetical protein
MLIKNLSFNDGVLQIFLANSREIRIPLEWFPKLRDAAPSQRQDWRLIGKGIGIHWPELDEDLSLEGLIG